MLTSSSFTSWSSDKTRRYKLILIPPGGVSYLSSRRELEAGLAVLIRDAFCGFLTDMRDHYHGFSHPVLVDLPAVPPSDLFTEMHVIADEIRTNPEHIV